MTPDEMLQAFRDIMEALRVEMAGYDDGMTAAEVAALQARLASVAAVIDSFRESLATKREASSGLRRAE